MHHFEMHDLSGSFLPFELIRTVQLITLSNPRRVFIPLSLKFLS